MSEEQQIHDAIIADLRLHNDRLNRELPLMRKENRRLMAFVTDAEAFIITGLNQGLDDGTILATLASDLKGIVHDEEDFIPAVTGFADLQKSKQ